MSDNPHAHLNHMALSRPGSTYPGQTRTITPGPRGPPYAYALPEPAYQSAGPFNPGPSIYGPAAPAQAPFYPQQQGYPYYCYPPPGPLTSGPAYYAQQPPPAHITLGPSLSMPQEAVFQYAPMHQNYNPNMTGSFHDQSFAPNSQMGSQMGTFDIRRPEVNDTAPLRYSRRANSRARRSAAFFQTGGRLTQPLAHVGGGSNQSNVPERAVSRVSRPLIPTVPEFFPASAHVSLGFEERMAKNSESESSQRPQPAIPFVANHQTVQTQVVSATGVNGSGDNEQAFMQTSRPLMPDIAPFQPDQTFMALSVENEVSSANEGQPLQQDAARREWLVNPFERYVAESHPAGVDSCCTNEQGTGRPQARTGQNTRLQQDIISSDDVFGDSSTSTLSPDKYRSSTWRQRRSKSLGESYVLGIPPQREFTKTTNTRLAPSEYTDSLTSTPHGHGHPRVFIPDMTEPPVTPQTPQLRPRIPKGIMYFDNEFAGRRRDLMSEAEDHARNQMQLGSRRLDMEGSEADQRAEASVQQLEHELFPGVCDVQRYAPQLPSLDRCARLLGTADFEWMPGDGPHHFWDNLPAPRLPEARTIAADPAKQDMVSAFEQAFRNLARYKDGYSNYQGLPIDANTAGRDVEGRLPRHQPSWQALNRHRMLDLADPEVRCDIRNNPKVRRNFFNNACEVPYMESINTNRRPWGRSPCMSPLLGVQTLSSFPPFNPISLPPDDPGMVTPAVTTEAVPTNENPTTTAPKTAVQSTSLPPRPVIPLERPRAPPNAPTRPAAMNNTERRPPRRPLSRQVSLNRYGSQNPDGSPSPLPRHLRRH
ncbi:hypothetical protein N7462_002499 [Penicillium macrosclerotiorum]|uniref:uncharacterized protein n=1 Tax=Penicillium macrosclerotiorum TaxID=303699 RepID=UPI002549B3E3|nr:uncharacterized protein N7462_002499 [Penicillium macrosclerotiorum]KAJ5693076.1 hypothetical protein N7462_002499 [Penicillium macrosclerotiorum]